MRKKFKAFQQIPFHTPLGTTKLVLVPNFQVEKTEERFNSSLSFLESPKPLVPSDPKNQYHFR